MNVAVPPLHIKKENSPDEVNHLQGELIIPESISTIDVTSSPERLSVTVKTEPPETSDFIDDHDGFENPYQCFDCGLDCNSQGELIDHYESAHTDGSSPKLEKADDTDDDPLAGDVAPDSHEKTSNVEGAQNDTTSLDVLLLYSCPCCGYSSSDWNLLTSHMGKHVQVTCLACSYCINIFSNSYQWKGYTGKDAFDQPHVCCHCPFTTQYYQELKDHCVEHHKNAVSDCNLVHAGHPSDSNRMEQCKSQTSPIAEASLRINPHPQHSMFPQTTQNEGQAGFMLLGSSIPEGHSVGKNMSGLCGVNLIPPHSNLSSTDQLPPLLVEDTVQNCRSNTRTLSLTPTLIPKMEIPGESNLDALHRLSTPMPINRQLLPKVPVHDMKLPSHNAVHVLQVSPPELKVAPALLTGMSPRSNKKGSFKSRKGIKSKPCPYCSHLARDSHSLKTHILTHTKEKPFACEFCSYRATQRAHINKHMSTHVYGNRRKRNVPL